jgi:hypothetical protein
MLGRSRRELSSRIRVRPDETRRLNMADDKTIRSGADRTRIDVSEDYECRYWSERFGVSADELKRAVQKVGPMAADVQRELGKGV